MHCTSGVSSNIIKRLNAPSSPLMYLVPHNRSMYPAGAKVEMHDGTLHIVQDFSKKQEAALAIRYTNTLHGFQSNWAGENTTVIAFVPENLNNSAVEEYIREQTGCESVEFDSWIGKDYLRIDTTDRCMIPRVINTYLSALQRTVLEPQPERPEGLSKSFVYLASFVNVKNAMVRGQGSYTKFIVTPEGHVFGEKPNIVNSDGTRLSDVDLQNHMLSGIPRGCKLQTKLNPWYEIGDEFSIEASETKFIDHWESQYQKEYMRRMCLDSVMLPDMCFDVGNWKTERGVAFCKRIRELCPYRIESVSTVEMLSNLTQGPDGAVEDAAIDYPLSIVIVPDEDDVTDIVPPMEIDEPVDCVVCQDRKADTLVLPCQHQVVCTQCSNQLVGTPNEFKCVVCRGDIDTVLCDG